MICLVETSSILLRSKFRSDKDPVRNTWLLLLSQLSMDGGGRGRGDNEDDYSAFSRQGQRGP
jgi:hypothetical protein